MGWAQGWNIVEDGRRRLFLLRDAKPIGGGKKLAVDVARRRSRRSRSSVRPNPFEDAVGVAYREIVGNMMVEAIHFCARTAGG
jgi:hypothetical protein